MANRAIPPNASRAAACRAAVLVAALAILIGASRAEETPAPTPAPAAAADSPHTERLYLAFSDVVALEMVVPPATGPVTSRELWRLALGEHVKDLRASRDGKQLLAATSAGLHVIDATTGKKTATLVGHPVRRGLFLGDEVLALAFKAAGEFWIERHAQKDGKWTQVARLPLDGQPDDAMLIADGKQIALLDIHARTVQVIALADGQQAQKIALDDATRKTHTILPRMLALDAKSKSPVALITEYGPRPLAYVVALDKPEKPLDIVLGADFQARALALDVDGERVWFFGPTGVLLCDPYSDAPPLIQEIGVSFQGAALSASGRIAYLSVPYIEKIDNGAVMIYDLKLRRITQQIAVAGLSPYPVVVAPVPASASESAPATAPTTAPSTAPPPDPR